MASLYRPRISTYKLNGSCRTPDGKRVTKSTPGAVRVDGGIAKTWYGKFTLEGGKVKRVKLTTDKTASNQILSKLVVDAKLAEHDLGGRFAEHAKRPLIQHAEDFRRYLGAKGNPANYVAMTLFRVLAILDGCKFVSVRDIQPSTVQEFLFGLQKEGKSNKTVNDYLAGLKRFTRWLRTDKRIPIDPAADISAFSRIEGDQKHPRREFTVDELDQILTAARLSVLEFMGLHGRDRHALYLCACSTGFRVGELASMMPESFNLSATAPTARVRASCTKNKREAVQPLPIGVADILRSYLSEKQPGKPVWPGRWIKRAAKMLRADLAEARKRWIAEAPEGPEREQRAESDFLSYCDREGRYGDFHALRHSYITMIGKCGISAREHQDLARHSSYSMTAKYSHSRSYNLDAAVQSLPIPIGGLPNLSAATGTDGHPATKPGKVASAPGPRLDQNPEILSYNMGRPEIESRSGNDRRKRTKTSKNSAILCNSLDENEPSIVTNESSGIRESNPLMRCPNSIPVNTSNDSAARRNRALTNAIADMIENDADLALILGRWPMLSARAKTALLAMVMATAGLATETTNGA